MPRRSTTQNAAPLQSGGEVDVRPSKVHSIGMNFDGQRLFRVNTRLRFKESRRRRAVKERRRRSVNGHERRRRECAEVNKALGKQHAQRYARSDMSTRFMVTSGVGQLIINLKAQRLNSKGVGKVATLAAPRWVDRIGAFCFGLKLSSHPSVWDRKYVLET